MTARPDEVIELACRRLAEGGRDEAEALLRDGLGQYPDDAWLLFHYARCIAAAGRHDEAIAMLRAAQARPGDTAPLALAEGDICCDRGDWASAERAFDTAARAVPGWVWPAIGLARAAASRGDHATAALRWREARAAAPSLPMVWRESVSALMAAGHTQDAIDVAREGIALLPDEQELRTLLASAEHSAEFLAAKARAARESGDRGALHRAIDAMANAVVAAPDPTGALLGLFRILPDGGDNELVCALFESVVWRIEISSHWVFHEMAARYASLGRSDAAFLMAALVRRSGANDTSAYASGRTLFMTFLQRGRGRDALAVVRDHLSRQPLDGLRVTRPLEALLAEHPDITDFRSPPIPPAARGHRSDISAFPAHATTPLVCTSYRGELPFQLEAAQRSVLAPAVSVAYLRDAELLLGKHAVIVVDAGGFTHDDLSVHDAPVFALPYFDAHAAEIPRHEAEAALVITDKYPTANLCHFLLDHITRLAAYERVGAPVGRAALVDTAPVAAFQTAILDRLGCTSVIDTGPVARVRVRELWVSSNCRDERHSAQYGAPWALDFLREKFLPEIGARNRRIFISRRDAGSRHIANEAEVQALLEAHGFETLCLGTLAFDAQVGRFAEATHVVGLHGAGLTHIVFCAPGTHVLEIFHPRYATASYAMLVPTLRLHYAVIVGEDAIAGAAGYNTRARNWNENDAGARDVHVELDALRRWLAATG